MRYTAANLDFNRDHDADFLAHLRKSADVLLVCEAKDLDLAALLPKNWRTTQDTSTPARAGSALCWNTATVRMLEHGLLHGSPAGTDVLERFIAWGIVQDRATGDRTKVFACHAPKKDTGMQAAFYASLASAVGPGHVVVGGDFNRSPLVVADMLGLRGDAAEVIGVLHSRSIRRVGLAHVDEVPMANNWTDHPTVSADLIHKETTVTAPDPYARSIFHGEPLDNASIAFLKLIEADLGYDLTILQGIGGAVASAGTHLEGRAFDLAPFDRERKLRALKDRGAIAWYRPAVVGLWGAHIHAVLIFESRTNTRGLAPSGFRQIAKFDARLDGLKSNLPDASYRPSPRAVFTMVEYAATFAPRVAPLPSTPRWDASVVATNTAVSEWRKIIAASPGTGAARDAQACIDGVAGARRIAKTRSTKF